MKDINKIPLRTSACFAVKSLSVAIKTKSHYNDQFPFVVADVYLFVK